MRNDPSKWRTWLLIGTTLAVVLLAVYVGHLRDEVDGWRTVAQDKDALLDQAIDIARDSNCNLEEALQSLERSRDLPVSPLSEECAEAEK